jgi:hypothetical protein
MNLKKLIVGISLFSLFFAILASPGSARMRHNSPTGLTVYIKDEVFHEKNIIKPRIYVENNSRGTIHSFELYYYFTAENHKQPVMECYYTPSANVTMDNLGHGDYCVRYRFNGLNIKPGECFPGRDGCVIGIHYPDWSAMDKWNDYSNPGSPDWKVTNRVKVKTSDDFRGGYHGRDDRDDWD